MQLLKRILETGFWLEWPPNRRKSALRLAGLHARIWNVRQDWLHQTATRMVREFSVIGIEDLNLQGMLANQRLARHIADIGFHEFRRLCLQLGPGRVAVRHALTTVCV